MSNPYQSPKYGGPPEVQARGPKPKSFLIESILLLIFCGGLFAIPAIVFAAQVDSKYNSGDYAGAVAASKNAKIWCIVAFCIGIVCSVASIGLFALTIFLDTQGF
ncbi:MAG TPA: CD225/dispanin family protein [Pirellulaceae bacterium]|nr:CD225/dispanin family protein [Pirellulaceae bacterium]HMO93949.1 CD225/dispanin family protein [Pirellulaceae bacterium]HMP67955.1 CD225/dispanin family protein [Pirellulaceae bacterium]